MQEWQEAPNGASSEVEDVLRDMAAEQASLMRGDPATWRKYRRLWPGRKVSPARRSRRAPRRAVVRVAARRSVRPSAAADPPPPPSPASEAWRRQ